MEKETGEREFLLAISLFQVPATAGADWVWARAKT